MAPEWWYYSVELEDGMHKGIYPEDLPMLPRMLMDRCDVKGMDVLDVGCMEGLIPALATKRGARAMGVDLYKQNRSKIDRVRKVYGDFEFREYMTAYGLSNHIPEKFDLINLSGLLYHVVSPLMVLMGARPMLKMGGVMIVGTNVIAQEGYFQEFNVMGKMQNEANTFWYPTVDLFEYLLRMVGLQPLAALYIPHASVGEVNLGEQRMQYVFDKPSGYMAIACMAVDKPHGDPWMRTAAATATDFERLMATWPTEPSKIKHQFNDYAPWTAVSFPTKYGANHTLRLADV